MKLKGIDFGYILNASGARNFFGETNAWWWHRFWKPFGLDWSGSTFVAKTTTIDSRPGNMPLTNTLQPLEFFPKCIRVNFRKAAVLNAVGLSGPGIDALLAANEWQKRTEPFIVSFMAVEPDPADRLKKTEQFCERMSEPDFDSPFGVEINLSCPNVGLDPSGLIKEAKNILDVFERKLPQIPAILKFNVLVPVSTAMEVASHKNCSAVTISNTLPWGKLPDRVDWKSLFGETSPLADFGGGGLSGSPLLPLIYDWVNEAHAKSFPVPIIAGGGILSAGDAFSLILAGASAIEIGSVAIVRPWRVAKIIRDTNLCTKSLGHIIEHIITKG